MNLGYCPSVPNEAQIAWFIETLRLHAKLHFRREVFDVLQAIDLRILPSSEISSLRSSGIFLRSDIPADLSGEVSTITFSGTTIALVDPLARPSEGDWKMIEVSGTPVWWISESGGITPAWNFFGVCFELLSARDEADTALDRFDGFVTSASRRARSGLLERPTVNEIFALIAAAALALFEGHERWFDLVGRVLPPLLFLSHDCDNLSGNSIWLQFARAKRLIFGTGRRSGPDFRQAGWAFKGLRRPEEGFANEVDDFMRVEEDFGFASRFYFLLGKRGRYGARSSLASTLAVARKIRPPHEIGLHYNQYGGGMAACLAEQMELLSKGLNVRIVSGRAHYLSFRPRSAPECWESVGLRLDESFGAADRPGFRLGMAGVFRWFSRAENRQLKLIECPLLFMDGAVLGQWPDDPFRGILAWVRHIEAIGGSVSLLFHPSYLSNPEFQSDATLYPRLLEVMRERGARQITTAQLQAVFGVS